MAEHESRGPIRGFVLLWLGLSTLLNVTGIASLIDNVILWADFFTNIIDVYRRTVGAVLSPIYSLFPLRVPYWVTDVLVLWSLSLLTTNFLSWEQHHKTIWGVLFEDRKHFVFMLKQALWPPSYIANLLRQRKYEELRTLGKYVLAIFSVLIFVLILNYRMLQ